MTLRQNLECDFLSPQYEEVILRRTPKKIYLSIFSKFQVTTDVNEMSKNKTQVTKHVSDMSKHI